jgi:hypothetical protein
MRLSLRAALVAGAAGGAAEMLWVAAYSSAAPLAGADVARQVAASVIPDAVHLAFAPIWGVAIHMLLSILLGLALAKFLFYSVVPRYGTSMLVPAALVALACIWAINFFIVLPVLNASFVTLMPLAATLTSKLLFGAAMGWTLQSAHG